MDTPLQSLIDTADRVYVVTQGHNQMVNRTNQYASNKILPPFESKLQKIAPVASSTRLERSHNSEDSLSRLRTATTDDKCYYHRVYGDRAIKCQSPNELSAVDKVL